MKTFPLPTATLGVPRIGPRRELKSALESYWSGRSDAAALHKSAAQLRAANWARQDAIGIDDIPSNDFSLYDHVLDTAVMVGAIPDIYGWDGGEVSLDTYFAMARGGRIGGLSVPALEMTKWFDTNYHYIVPQLSSQQRFTLATTKPLVEFSEAKALGFDTRPVLLGPVSFLKLAKAEEEGFDTLSLLEGLLPVYGELLDRFREAGAEWVQIDEPCLSLDADAATQTALKRAYDVLAPTHPYTPIMLNTYFGGLGDNLATALGLPVAGLHLDLTRGGEELERIAEEAPPCMVLSLGAIDGRNIWRADLEGLVGKLTPIVACRGRDHVEISPSCSLMHVPIDVELEEGLDPQLKSWLAFARQKMEEIVTLARALGEGRQAVAGALESSRAVLQSRRGSQKVHDREVARRAAGVEEDMARRKSPFARRQRLQAEKLNLPLFATTTIGSFPQTSEVRRARAAHARGETSAADYDAFLRAETEKCVRWQEDIGLDVLVHGEFERNDMVQYFGERLSGFAFTRHAWVQSYGSRYVRPPVIFGDVSRPEPMTVKWWRYAQSLTERPVKGMLTGPVTILNWSFVRDDLPRAEVCRQIALAIRDEVLDLEAAGAAMIQIDEAALREGLPLKRAEWDAYLGWAVGCFRLAAGGVGDATQIHTHMCYAQFNDIIEAIGAMDADVISIETSRSRMELLDAFVAYRYPNEIGPGVYDIHSPRVPTVGEMVDLIERAVKHLGAGQIWVNPDCGLKTRGWEEVRLALTNMVAAARRLRSELADAAE